MKKIYSIPELRVQTFAFGDVLTNSFDITENDPYANLGDAIWGVGG